MIPLSSFNPCFSGTYSRTSYSLIRLAACFSGFNPCFSGTYSRTVSSSSKLFSQSVVSILVLVELTLGQSDDEIISLMLDSFNPCFSGTYSRTTEEDDAADIEESFNPCFSGTYSRTWLKFRVHYSIMWVSILVLVELTLGR